MVDNDTRESGKYILLCTLLGGVLAYFGYEYGYRPKAEEIAALESRLETLQLKNQTARILAERDARGEAEQRLEAYRNHLALVERLIPASEELSELLDAISVEAQQAGVELSLIQPTEAVAENQYTRRTYSLGVLGSYHEIGQFLTQIASLPRIITPTDLNVVVREEGTSDVDPILEAMFAIETYVLPSSMDGGRLAREDGARDISPSLTDAGAPAGREPRQSDQVRRQRSGRRRRMRFLAPVLLSCWTAAGTRPDAPLARNSETTTVMRYRSVFPSTLLVSICSVVGASCHGQDSPADAPPVYERETFTYDPAGRVDPFRSLLGGAEVGFRFEDLSLLGVVYDPNPRRSIAVLSRNGQAQRIRARVGDRFGAVRVVAIMPDRVDLMIDELGVLRRGTLHLRRPQLADGER